MIRLSVVVPIYNTMHYLGKCVDSILSQTMRDLELILVDDGSTDTCSDMCDEYARIDKRVRVIHKPNGGLSSARNAGIEIAQGKFIAFVDSDDYIEPDMYKDMISASEKYQVPLVISGRFVHSGDSVETMFTLEKELKMKAQDAIAGLLTWNGLDSSACDKIFQRSLFSSVRFPPGKYNEDVFVMSEIISSARHVVHIGRPMYHYVQRSNSITTASFHPQKLDLLEATAKVLQFIKKQYPTLEGKAISYNAKGLLYLYPLLLRSEEYENYKAYEHGLHSQLKRQSSMLIFSRDFSLKEKAIAMALLFRIYNRARNAYHRLRRSHAR